MYTKHKMSASVVDCHRDCHSECYYSKHVFRTFLSFEVGEPTKKSECENFKNASTSIFTFYCSVTNIPTAILPMKKDATDVLFRDFFGFAYSTVDFNLLTSNLLDYVRISACFRMRFSEMTKKIEKCLMLL